MNEIDVITNQFNESSRERKELLELVEKLSEKQGVFALIFLQNIIGKR